MFQRLAEETIEKWRQTRALSATAQGRLTVAGSKATAPLVGIVQEEDERYRLYAARLELDAEKERGFVTRVRSVGVFDGFMTAYAAMVALSVYLAEVD